LVISYSLAPSVVSFSGQQLSSQTASFTLELSEPIIDLTASDLVIDSQSCAISSIAIDDKIGTIELTGCSNGEVTMTLLAYSVGANDSGPTTAEVATLFFDGQGPSFEWSQSPEVISTSDLVISFTASDMVNLTSESFVVEGCQLAVSSSAAVLSSCSHGLVSLALRPFALEDSWGNTSPAEPISLSFVVDQEGPIASWSEVEILGSGPFSYSATLSFSEPASFSPTLVTFSAEIECQLGNQQTPEGWLFSASCGYGTGNWTLASSSVSDTLGNFGTQGSLSIGFSNPEPELPAPEPQAPQEEAPTAPADPAPELPAPTPPAPTPTPDSTPAPEAPVGEPEPEVVAPASDSEDVSPVSQSDEIDPASESPSVSAAIGDDLAVELEREIVTVPPSPARAEEQNEPVETENPEAAEPRVSTESSEVSVVQTLEPDLPVAEPVAFQGEPEPETGFPWQVALATAVILAAGALALRFSGR
jgi:hypothetical protein